MRGVAYASMRISIYSSTTRQVDDELRAQVGRPYIGVRNTYIMLDITFGTSNVHLAWRVDVTGWLPQMLFQS